MASNARRNPVRELALLVRAPEPCSSNLGAFLAENATELAQALGVPARELEGARVLDDEEVAPRIRKLLARRRDEEEQRDVDRRRERSLAAAQRLGATVQWTDVGAVLDLELLLGELLADGTKKWIGFVEPGGFQVTVPRQLVAAARPLRKLHMDLVSYVNERGLSFRWRAGCGGYTWYSREIHPSLAGQVLAVTLAPRVAEIQPERQRGGAWLGHILEELGYL